VAGLDSAIAQAEKAGALGAFLSGAGPTLMAITTKSEKTIGQAMVQALRQAGHHSVDLKILSADNSGLRIVKSLP
jgi:homoserine kinase